MQHVTLEQLADLLEVMTVTQSVNNSFAIIHHGHVGGVPTIAISTHRGEGDCYIIH